MYVAQQDVRYWLAAVHLPGIGPIKIHRWLNHFKTIENLFSASLHDLELAGLKSDEAGKIKNPDWKSVDADLCWREKNNGELIPFTHPSYPTALRELNDAPLLLYVRGKVEVLARSQIAIVGSRNPTPVGEKTAEQFAYCLAQAGLVITSGLAMGIDAAAHAGALAASAVTIAVIGTGLNQIYPASNELLAEKIVSQGAIVSEFPPNTPAHAKNFPRRNRIISGLSAGVVVVEAALRSGSLITARFAAEQGREVFAIPGSIHNPLARGCHQLIRQGAKLVETAEDILEELRTFTQFVTTSPVKKSAPMNKKHDKNHIDMISLLGDSVMDLDTVIQRSGLTVAEVSSMLLTLELQGYVQSVSGGYIRSSS